MKKVLIFIILCLFSVNAHAFWVWSSKSKKLRHPVGDAQSVPSQSFERGQEYFQAQDYKKARREFSRLLKRYPDALEAAEARYYLGRVFQATDKPFDAFLEYQKVVDSYPNSQRINEIIARQFELGEFFMAEDERKLLGVSVYEFREHPSIEIFTTIAQRSPYSEYAPHAQFKLGMLFLGIGRYEESRQAFQKILDDYPDSEWVAPAKYQMAIATAKGFKGVDYDSTSLEEASERLDEFIYKHPEAEVAEAATEQLKELRNTEAEKQFAIGRFYEKQKKYKAAGIYYNIVINDYRSSSYADQARSCLQGLEDK